jgi:miniconductance mechanosensitive channel
LTAPAQSTEPSIQFIEDIRRFFAGIAAMHPLAEAAMILGALLLGALIAWWIARRIVVRVIDRVLSATPLPEEKHYVAKIVARLSYAVPALVIEEGIVLVPGIPGDLLAAIQAVMSGLVIFTMARAISAGFDLVNAIYERHPDAATRPIKGYLQVGKILVYAAAAILIVAAIMDESPLLLLSGLGAMAAVLMLIFRDTILSLVASVQLRSNDMLRVGDWIEMSQLGADGDVIDIALHTVKVQNFDKTVTTIPTHRLISDSFRNWRGMREYGARRIKRALHIDKASIAFMDDAAWGAMRRFALLHPYLEDKQAELDEWNAKMAAERDATVNRRRATNIGTFRAYVTAYLKAHSSVDHEKTLLVRQLDPKDNGLPIEIYCFAGTTAWAEYEAIMADIFDHLLAIMPEFGLRLFQAPSGHDMQAIGSGPRHDAEVD